MKKFLAASFISALFFSACQPASPVSQNIFDECLTIPEPDASNKCLMKIATDMIYYEIYEKDIQICQKMSKDLPYYQECYWLFAMIQKDSKICESLPEKSQNAELEGEWFSGAINYLTKSDCKNELHFKSENSEWNLMSGIPPLADPYQLVYSGNATIQGWLIKEEGYGDELVTYFHVSKDSKKRLPSSIIYNDIINFALKYKDEKISIGQYVPQTVISKLEKYNEKNPATIKIDSIAIPMEGKPVMNLMKIVNN